MIFGPPPPPPLGVPHFSASRALIENRLDTSANLAHRSLHAKFWLIWTVSLVRAMGGRLY